MNNNNLFKFLSNLMEEITNNQKVQQLDFTKKEDVEKLDNTIKFLKENKFLSSFFNNDIFEELQDKAHKIYEDSLKNQKKEQPQRPSDEIPEKIKNNIHKLAKEYVDTTINPYIDNLSETQYNEIIDSLSEFACWMYKK